LACGTHRSSCAAAPFPPHPRSSPPRAPPPEQWYGLELEREIGKHEGTVLGRCYFTTARKRATFVRRENLSPYDAEAEAGAVMASALRVSLAKKKARAEVTWRAFAALDADDEHRVLLRRQRLMKSALGARMTRERPEAGRLEAWAAEAEALPVPPGYDGAHIEFPLTLPQVMALLHACQRGAILHYKYAVRLLRAFHAHAAALPTLVEAAVEPGTRLTVCGDTHGQLQDLFSVFALNGVPSPTNRYLINGDFVDRGDRACEIVLVLAAFALLYPGEPGTGAGGACMLNRGNHECSGQNVMGGFLSEVLDKYATYADAAAAAHEDAPAGSFDTELGLQLYDHFQAAFDMLPLAHLLKDGPRRVFVVHGGLMQHPGVTLAHIASVNRKREIPFGARARALLVGAAGRCRCRRPRRRSPPPPRPRLPTVAPPTPPSRPRAQATPASKTSCTKT